MRLVIVSSILPVTNYSAYLIEALQKKLALKVETLVYTSREKENKKTDLKNVKLVWNKNLAYPFQVSFQVIKDKPQVVHLQHEINMFGGLGTALIFPLLPLFLKMMGVKTVITIHAVVSPKQINQEFLETFWRSQNKCLIPLIKTFFFFLYKSLGWSADKIIVHSQGLRKILTEDYRLESNKVVVVLEGIPDEIKAVEDKEISQQIKKQIQGHQFMLSYGYLHRRKRIELLFKALQIIGKKYPEVLLVLAGGTLQKDYEEKLKRMVLKLKLSKKVVFLGFVKENELHWLIDQSLFVLLPALFSIAASGPLSQIIAHHKPVIVSKIGVFKEEINDSFDGLLAQNSAYDWAIKAERLIKDKKLAKKIALNLAKKHQARKWSVVAEQTYNLYQTLI